MNKRTLPKLTKLTKLELSKETIRVLPESELQQVAGGGGGRTIKNCPVYTC